VAIDATRPGMMPNALSQSTTIVEQEQLAAETYRIRILVPEIARQIIPGQFVMIRPANSNDPLLGRPFALYDTYSENGVPAGIDIVYLVIGKLTNIMTSWSAGEPIEIWGPLGNGFPLLNVKRLDLIAGGIGQTPFLAVIREAFGEKKYGSSSRQITRPAETIRLFYGARNASYHAGLSDFEAAGAERHLSSDDGSCGFHGYVTAMYQQHLADTAHPEAVFCCGPEPMMSATARICASENLACWLSLESPMACGFGACFSCVTKVRLPEGSWDYRRSCVEGPIFPAEQLVLE